MRMRLLLAATFFVAACSSSSTPPKDGGTSNQGDATTTPNPDPGPAEWRSAVGEGGVFVQTYDGASWSARTITDRTLFDVDCVSPAIGWAVGERGFVAHTTDSGRTWVPQDAKTTVALRTVAFLDRDTGIVAGDDGVVAVTHDAGATWTRATVGIVTRWRASAVRADRGFVLVGDDGVVARAAADGTLWTATTLSGSGHLSGVTFAGSEVVAVDEGGHVWSTSATNEGFVVVGRSAAPLAAVSSTADGTHAFAVGSGGALLVRDSGGQWVARESGVRVDLRSVLATEQGLVYIAGDQGTLRVWGIDALTFQPLASGTAQGLRALDNL
jgi:photosystem II stability/assembly factor-like uncharacterized protein